MVLTVRAPLFVPADRPDRFAKAAASGADAMVLDLEDGVAAGAKAQARQAVTAGFTGLPVILRINAAGTEWHKADLAAAGAGGFAAVMLPKAEDPAGVAAVLAALPAVPLIPLIETARGLAGARALAALPGVVRLAFGSLDFCADMGCAHRRDVLLPVRGELVLASRIAGIAPPLDGVTAAIGDAEAVADDAAHARDMGMTGKLCIHPAQVAPILRALAPSPGEIDWARRVLASGDGAAVVDGRMTDEPVRRRARAVLAAGRGEGGGHGA
ncbi:CoA ester lyase [Aliigemmobacter aestuarii]|uniref:CoA ester lyase n=1 Tax=Aliigemmobacter aestuarii TaxID=1445661 RepID=A0A4S3MQ93_9RHOB|nr:CoA ester lyase [Gemmobacter aestuarii]THD84700.1 CoA ester lyase [Gemmobacter aestuarii]